LGDFGFARPLSNGQYAHTFVGSPLTMAPEIAERKPYDMQCDMYSLGAMFYQMLFGCFPYQHVASGNNPQLLASII
jgi:serine/threonine protein kinase